jgi:hypothetical protein
MATIATTVIKPPDQGIHDRRMLCTGISASSSRESSEGAPRPIPSTPVRRALVT